MTIFSVNNLSKSYGDGPLFENISFGMEQGEKIGLIGRNGAGKSTLLKIIGGLETPDTGEAVLNSNIKVEYLTQSTEYEDDDEAIDYVVKSIPELYSSLKEYHELLKNNSANTDRIIELSHRIDELNGWGIEAEAKKTLQRVGITDFNLRLKYASGGEKKRIAIARVLISKPDLLILDEPTNHLDADTVQWLQDELSQSNLSIIFVTHDRYFLDSLSTRIIELDLERLFSYQGNYENYLMQKAIFLQTEKSTNDHLQNKLRTELEWLSRGAKARRTKQKSRIDWAGKLKDDIRFVDQKKIKIEVGNVFLGSKIIEAHNISYSIKDRLLINNFNYTARPTDKIGIIGPNGSGKSSLLKIFTEKFIPQKGSCKLGTTVKIGHYEQEIESLDQSKTVIASLREIAEYINVGVGRDRKLTAAELLDKFLFPRKRQNSYVHTLSGGEKKRLALLRLLMANPNVLLLDEPTNDFDIETLNVLEDYLDNFYGVLIVVSHDRAFLDRCVEFIWSFEGNGKIKEYPGNYSDYLVKKESNKVLDRENKLNEKKAEPIVTKEIKPQNSAKLSFKEKIELEQLDIDIPNYESRINEIQAELAAKFSDYKLVESLNSELVEITTKLNDGTERWLELSEKQG